MGGSPSCAAAAAAWGGWAGAAGAWGGWADVAAAWGGWADAVGGGCLTTGGTAGDVAVGGGCWSTGATAVGGGANWGCNHVPELKPLEGPRKLCTAGADEAGMFVGCLIAGEGDLE